MLQLEKFLIVFVYRLEFANCRLIIGYFRRSEDAGREARRYKCGGHVGR